MSKYYMFSTMFKFDKNFIICCYNIASKTDSVMHLDVSLIREYTFFLFT